MLRVESIIENLEIALAEAQECLEQQGYGDEPNALPQKIKFALALSHKFKETQHAAD